MYDLYGKIYMPTMSWGNVCIDYMYICLCHLNINLLTRCKRWSYESHRFTMMSTQHIIKERRLQKLINQNSET